jgi:hypothetical protein
MAVPKLTPVGIGGLACAYALGRSGHLVRVLEKTAGRQVCLEVSYVSNSEICTARGRRPGSSQPDKNSCRVGPRERAQKMPDLSKNHLYFVYVPSLHIFRITLTRCVRIVESGDVLGVLEWKEDVLHEAGGQFLLIRVRNSLCCITSTFYIESSTMICTKCFTAWLFPSAPWLPWTQQ